MRLEQLRVPYIILTDSPAVCAFVHARWPLPAADPAQPHCAWASEPIESNPGLYDRGGETFIIALRYMVAAAFGAR